MSVTTKSIAVYVCDLCGSEEEQNEVYAVSTVRITLQWLDSHDNGEPVTVEVCGNCQGHGRRGKSGDPGIRALVSKLSAMRL